jgi:hypothetical protein
MALTALKKPLDSRRFSAFFPPVSISDMAGTMTINGFFSIPAS